MESANNRSRHRAVWRRSNEDSAADPSTSWIEGPRFLAAAGPRTRAPRRRCSLNLELPGWALVSEKRPAHITRLTRIVDQWALCMRADHDEPPARRARRRLHAAAR